MQGTNTETDVGVWMAGPGGKVTEPLKAPLLSVPGLTILSKVSMSETAETRRHTRNGGLSPLFL
jgi:hypothetical protein